MITVDQLRFLDDRKLRGLPRRLCCAVLGHRPDVGLLGGSWLVLACERCHQLTAVCVGAAAGQEPAALSLTDRQLAAVALLTAGLGPEPTRAGDVCDVIGSVRPADLHAVVGISAIYAGSMSDDPVRSARFLQECGRRLSWVREFGDLP